METKQTILVIDDDPTLRELLEEFLRKFGYRVLLLENGEDAETTVAAEAPDLVVLDIMMPGRDGVEVLKALRRDSSVPVIMLTARGEDMDRVLGLELGADDYMGKPFNPRELLARIKAVLRRVRAPEPAVSAAEGYLECGGMKLNRTKQRLERGEGSESLSYTEFRLIEVLMERPDRILSRDRLMELVHERNYEVYDRSIDVHISKLRALIRRLGDEGERIRTYWGSGYMFVSDQGGE